jgi:hypothetical protein
MGKILLQHDIAALKLSGKLFIENLINWILQPTFLILEFHQVIAWNHYPAAGKDNTV